MLGQEGGIKGCAHVTRVPLSCNEQCLESLLLIPLSDRHLLLLRSSAAVITGLWHSGYTLLTQGFQTLLTHWVLWLVYGLYPDGALCSLCSMHSDPAEWQVVGGKDIYVGYIPKLPAM